MTAPYYQDHSVTLYHGDALEVVEDLPDGAADCIVTSPPYFGLRDYGEPGQYGLEDSPAEYVENMSALFAELRRVLADDGTLWLNLGDTYTSQPGWGRGGSSRLLGRKHAPELDTVKHRRGLAAKNLLGIPWRVAFALQDDGWILRNDNIWSKPNTMPESVNDRLSSKHEYVFMFSKSQRYYFDLDAIRVEAVTTRESALSWDRAEQGIPGQKPQHRPGRPQRIRAEQIAREKGLSQAHFDAIRAAGVTYAGKATVMQTGAGKNTAEVQRLAAEAKSALGGYYREFLTPAGKNPGDVWEIATQPFPGAHFATMPPALAQRCVAAGCKPGGTVLDPFSGSGTTGMAAQRLDRKYVGIDLNRDYLDLSLRTRFGQPTFDFEAGA
ncbi:site-specific DNA-methyltransferase [Mycobacteroides abscessus]|uniref:DNA-methyltransferase n=1 Tax=Mycobacteroides abscessus TaxID=36809 RepID=UPI00078BDE56|nr:site-specific DNA-methyltransferase [Mycobacteroides abscessus]AMU71460.1 DNA methylase N-4/N-6 [Mycobacteroides abscessus]MDM2015302.1 site-specific DNA-methyltransferase [Mycobacteroides abscessus]MDM2019680.1 site-specific DNA-methyltransferase [Mycobacteroides abscessus]MDM2025111.1 site-specific DNA-methyltransferase [Mycobacteroides abscessus]MDM2027782.1 site-specific DNA-methyltransferase [Mycobacteroides abscessus]